MRGKVACAIYTRKSSEEGLEQAFNSLDAQREACEAYVRSQRHEGWVALAEPYDDGGFSGGSMERPALQRLMADIQAGRVNVVVVYKVDRLTRSLSDFARIVDAFDARKVSFVSVTQQFNTTSSMGRLTLNMLLSFAQFEREVTGERIRDKIAASKRKGMWMGGTTPLGYVAKDRTLAVHPDDAATVRTLFRLYLELGSVAALRAEAWRRGLRSREGNEIQHGSLYLMLQNPAYRGLIRHKEQVYPGLHPAIIDPATWDAVQAVLAANRQVRRDGGNAKEPILLTGRLHTEGGRPFTPSQAVKQGRRYRYYIERRDPDVILRGRRPRLRRIPAPEIEGHVVDAMARLLRRPQDLITALGDPALSASATSGIAASAKSLAESIERDPRATHKLLRDILQRVTIEPDAIRIDIARAQLAEAVGQAMPVLDPTDTHSLRVPAKLKARGVELRFILHVEASRQRPEPDAPLIRASVRGRDWFDRLMAADRPTMHDLAQADGVTPAYLRRLLDLAFLAPDIVAAILDGRQPADLTAERLTRLGDLPLDWAAQRRVLGFG